jgi:hypothetical protein
MATTSGIESRDRGFSQNQTSTLHSHMQIETPADTLVPSEKLNTSREHQDTNWEIHDTSPEKLLESQLHKMKSEYSQK